MPITPESIQREIITLAQQGRSLEFIAAWVGKTLEYVRHIIAMSHQSHA